MAAAVTGCDGEGGLAGVARQEGQGIGTWGREVREASPREGQWSPDRQTGSAELRLWTEVSSRSGVLTL